MAYFAVDQRSLGQMRPTGDDGRAGFDQWLRRQLSVTLDPERGPKPHPSGASYAIASRKARTRLVAVRSSVVAAFGAKAVAGGDVAALAAGGATAAIAATGSLSPVNWGQHVVQAVERCKVELGGPQETAGGGPDRGIGHCVSAVDRQHGP